MFILSRLFRALFFLFFFRDVSTLAFLHFFNRNEESFRQSLSLDTMMQSIQSTVVVEVRFKFSLSFKLSFFTSFVARFISRRSLLPSPKLPSSFGKSRSVMMITFLDIFLDRLPGKRFVVLFTLISLFSLSLTRAFLRQTRANECKQTAIFVQALVRGVFSQNVRAEENLVEHPQRGE